MNLDNLLKAARSAEANGQTDRIAQLCNQALSIDPRCTEALLMLGSLAARTGRTVEAEAILRQAASIDANSYDAHRWLTTSLIGRNGGSEAVEFGQRSVELRPNEVEPHLILGLAAMGSGDNSLAIESFQSALEMHPQLSGAHHNLGVAYQREESFEEAVESFQRAVALSPRTLESLLHLGRCYLALEKGDEALDCGRRALELNPNSVTAKNLLADAYFAAVHGENGIEHIRTAIAQDPNAAFPYAVQGSRLQEQGDFSGALDSIQKSIDLQPIQGFAYYLLAHNGKVREHDRPTFAAIEKLDEQGEMVLEDRQYLHFALGKAYDDLGDYEKAITHFDLAHEHEDSHPSPSTFSDKSRIGPIPQIFTPDIFERLADLRLETEEPIFIFGMPRSGTTLLEQIVSRHSTVEAGGELFFWRDNSRKIVNIREGAINPKEMAKAGQRYLDLLRSIGPGKSHITDKFPSNYNYLGILHLLYPKARFLHARRNPVDTSLSIYMRPFTTNQGLGRNRHEIVQTYKIYRETIQYWRDTLGSDRFLDVDYEHLVQDPETMIRKVIEYCGLEWEDTCLEPQEGNRRVITFSKWQVRQPVYTTSVERWRNYEPWLGVFRELVE